MSLRPLAPQRLLNVLDGRLGNPCFHGRHIVFPGFATRCFFDPIRVFLHPNRVTLSLEENVPLPAQPKTRHASVTGGPASPLPGRDFIPSDHQANNLRPLFFLEVASHHLGDCFVQLFERCRLGDYRVTDRTCHESTLARLFDDENDLGLWLSGTRDLQTFET